MRSPSSTTLLRRRSSLQSFSRRKAKAPRMLDVHKRAEQAQQSFSSITLFDDELLSSVVSLAQSIMAALDAASQKADNYHLHNIIRGVRKTPARRAEDMRETNKMFTQTTPAFLVTIFLDIEEVKDAFSSP